MASQNRLRTALCSRFMNLVSQRVMTYGLLTVPELADLNFAQTVYIALK